MQVGKFEFLDKEGTETKMIALDNFDKKIHELDILADIYLNHQELEEYKKLSEEDVREKLRRLLESPIADFSVNGLTCLSRADIDSRFEMLRNLTSF